MASSKQLLLLAVVAAVASLASATVFMVGDDLGWRPAFNQTGWANDKTFVVGDSLMFMYDKEKHTVAQVHQEVFAACNLQDYFIGGPWTTGNDVVTLDKPGKAWFICTKPGHCDNGMKLVVDVVDPTAVTPAPAPSPWTLPFPGVRAPAPAFGWDPPAPASVAAPPSAAVRNLVGGAVAAAAAAVVEAALAF